MLGRNHFSSGVVTGSLVATATHLSPGQAVAFIGAASVCALLPDFDHPDAMLPRMFAWPGRATAAIIGHLFGHRTLTHSFLGMAILAGGLVFIPGLPVFLAGAILLGCLTHVAGDMLTVSGVPVWWPHRVIWRLSPKRFAFRTGGHMEQLVMTPLLAIAAVASLGLVVAANV
jgi:inner membrane protein